MWHGLLWVDAPWTISGLETGLEASKALQTHDAGGLVWLLAIGNEANRTDAKYLLDVKENVSMMGQLGVGERKGESRLVRVVHHSLWIQLSEKILTCLGQQCL